MDILFCSKKTAFGNTPVGGAETSMRLMAESLTQTDCKPIYLICGINRSGAVTGPEFINGIKIYHYYATQFPFLERIGWRLRCVGLVFRLQHIVSMFLLRRLLKQLLATHDIGTIYTSYDREILLPLLKFKRKTKSAVKIVMRMAGLYWYERSKGDESQLREYEYIFNQVDSINYLTGSLKQLAESKMRELNMRVSSKNEFVCDIGSGLVPGHNDVREKPGSGEFFIVSIMRFSDYQKRQDLLLHALALIKKSVPFKALFIGTGIRREEMIELAHRLGISERIVFKEYMKQDELWRAMAQADLLCHCCEYEGVSKIILESMAMGLPVLASDVVPLGDYVFDGVNGFLVKNEPAAWAEKINFLCTNKVALKGVSMHAPRYIQENYNPKVNILAYLEHFKALQTGN